MDNVLYILGAGFSAPLGLPVMSNFLMKSKDMFALEPHKYSHFQKVYDLISEMSTVKNYFDANLFNIEEILSIIEMRKRIGSKAQAPVVKYISDVIAHFTPPPFRIDTTQYPGNWHDHFITEGAEWKPYAIFALSLLGIQITSKPPSGASDRFSFSVEPVSTPHAKYGDYPLRTGTERRAKNKPRGNFRSRADSLVLHPETELSSVLGLDDLAIFRDLRDAN